MEDNHSLLHASLSNFSHIALYTGKENDSLVSRTTLLDPTAVITDERNKNRRK